MELMMTYRHTPIKIINKYKNMFSDYYNIMEIGNNIKPINYNLFTNY